MRIISIEFIIEVMWEYIKWEKKKEIKMVGEIGELGKKSDVIKVEEVESFKKGEIG